MFSSDYSKSKFKIITNNPHFNFNYRLKPLGSMVMTNFAIVICKRVLIWINQGNLAMQPWEFAKNLEFSVIGKTINSFKLTTLGGNQKKVSWIGAVSCPIPFNISINEDIGWAGWIAYFTYKWFWLGDRKCLRK